MEDILDIYKTDKKFEYIQRKIADDSKIKSENKKHIKGFLDYLFVRKMKSSSMTRDLYALWFFAHNTNTDFKKAKKEDFYHLIRLVEQQQISVWTKRKHAVVLKKFMKWLKGENKFYPPEVEDISITKKPLNAIMPDEILSNEEVQKIIESCDNIRNKTFVMTLALLGIRIGEALNMKIKHVRFQDTGEVICMITGKTGFRTTVSIPLSPQLANYIENGHPTRIPEDYLWLTKNNRITGFEEQTIERKTSKGIVKKKEYRAIYVPLTYAGAVKALKKAAVKAGITKKVSPHWFRRYAATEDASYMSDRSMMQKYGWSSPEVVGTYSKLRPQNLIDIERRRHGKISDQSKPKFSIITCPRCRLDNPPASKFCSKCGMVLSMETAEKIRNLEDDYQKFMGDSKNKKLILQFIEFMQKEGKKK